MIKIILLLMMGLFTKLSISTFGKSPRFMLNIIFIIILLIIGGLLMIQYNLIYLGLIYIILYVAALTMLYIFLLMLIPLNNSSRVTTTTTTTIAGIQQQQQQQQTGASRREFSPARLAGTLLSTSKKETSETTASELSLLESPVTSFSRWETSATEVSPCESSVPLFSRRETSGTETRGFYKIRDQDGLLNPREPGPKVEQLSKRELPKLSLQGNLQKRPSLFERFPTGNSLSFPNRETFERTRAFFSKALFLRSWVEISRSWGFSALNYKSQFLRSSNSLLYLMIFLLIIMIMIIIGSLNININNNNNNIIDLGFVGSPEQPKSGSGVGLMERVSIETLSELSLQETSEINPSIQEKKLSERGHNGEKPVKEIIGIRVAEIQQQPQQQQRLSFWRELGEKLYVPEMRISTININDWSTIYETLTDIKRLPIFFFNNPILILIIANLILVTICTLLSLGFSL